uniref:BTB domain-containing protein n=1 Tax=Panagrolaimus sp. ES5 TaxID=591445 RepID=A0AC34FA11_9BILA
MKHVMKNEYLQSDTFTAIHTSDVKYALRMYPNGDKPENRGRSKIGLYLIIGNEKKVVAEYTISIKSANWNYRFDFTFDKCEGYGISCCSVDELFDSSKKFIVDGKFIVRVEGILMVEIPGSKWKPLKNSCELWNSDLKDFTIVVDKKEIKAHKCVLECQSSLFASMFKSPSKETTENKIEITDFSFETVDKAVKLCYDHNLVPDVTVHECFLLIKFAEKYKMTKLQKNLQDQLGDKITVENVCEIANFAITSKSSKLEKECLDGIIAWMTIKKYVPGMSRLDPDFLDTVFVNFSCHFSVTI